MDPPFSRMFFETSGDYIDAFTEFYEAYMVAMDPDDGTGDVSSMAISPDFSAGIYELENLRAHRGYPLACNEELLVSNQLYPLVERFMEPRMYDNSEVRYFKALLMRIF